MRTRTTSAEITTLITALLLVAVYFVLRYQTHWAETDTSILAKLIYVMQEEEQLIPVKDAYSQGYAYPTISLFLTTLTGLSVQQYQQIFAPLLAIWLVVPAWLMYRALLGNQTAASLSVLLLLIQPEFLFVILRSSHEKFTRGLIFMVLLLLIQKLRRPSDAPVWIITFYGCVFALIANNAFIAFSIIIALLVASFGVGIANRWWVMETVPAPQLSRTVIYSLLSAMLLAFLFLFYIYPPATQTLQLLDTIGDRIAAIFLEVETTGDINQPYQAVTLGWRSLPIYFAVSLVNWVTLISATLLWVIQTVGLLLGRHKLARSEEVILWALFGAFGLFGALSIFVDISGASATNFQVRNFPTFSMLGVAVIAVWLQKRRIRPILPLIVTLLIALSTLKITSEPQLSNNWIFYRPHELTALHWADNHVDRQTIWTDFNERIDTAYQINYPANERRNLLDNFQPQQGTTLYLITEITRLRQSRLGVDLPTQPDALRVYDNGVANIYRRRPRTPFQK